jgi:diphthine-ammonia ligase
MRLGVLFSGGKDSCLALYKSLPFHDVVCLISLLSENQESYMFHVPNIEITRQQAEAIGLPLVQRNTRGEKEKELVDLEKVVDEAKADYRLEGVISGAVRSIYQTTRIQRICRRLDLWCFDPLWLKDEIELLNEVLETGFEVIISGVFAYPLDREFLGSKLDRAMIQRLEKLKQEYGINPAGEGGEIETTVTDAPFFKKKLEILSYDVSYKDNVGTFKIEDLRLIDK